MITVEKSWRLIDAAWRIDTDTFYRIKEAAPKDYADIVGDLKERIAFTDIHFFRTRTSDPLSRGNRRFPDAFTLKVHQLGIPVTSQSPLTDAMNHWDGSHHMLVASCRDGAPHLEALFEGVALSSAGYATSTHLLSSIRTPVWVFDAVELVVVREFLLPSLLTDECQMPPSAGRTQKTER